MILLAALVSSNCSRFLVYAGFESNQKYIAENLCANKNRPWLQCNGQCYLMKKIEQAEENEKKQQAKDNLSRIEISFFEAPFTFKFNQAVILELQPSGFPQNSSQYHSLSIGAIFHPPKQIA